MATRICLGTVLISGALVLPATAQDRRAEKESSKIEALEKKVEKLQEKVKMLEGGTGSGGSLAPFSRTPEFQRLQQEGDIGETGLGTSALDERIRIGGRLDFEFFDAQGQYKDLGTYGPVGNQVQVGPRNGGTELRLRRFQFNLGLQLIRDFSFETTLVFDPVVRDEADHEEGSVDVDEAYFKFQNLGQYLFDLEDPSHTYLMAGNFYRWERSFFPRWHATWSLPGTSFYMDEVTGLGLGGTFETGFFYSASVENGTNLSVRDAGQDRLGAAPILHDDELSGDSNNSKDVAFGLGIQDRLEGPGLEYRVAVSYRVGKLSPAEKSFLNSLNTSHGAKYDGSNEKMRFGVLGGFDHELEFFHWGVDAEIWWAEDGNAERNILSLGPHIKLPLEGLLFQDRTFFTGLGFAYRLGYLHQSEALYNVGVATNSLFNDYKMHTVTLGLDVTQNVDMVLEMNTFSHNGPDVSDTEWLLRWSVTF